MKIEDVDKEMGALRERFDFLQREKRRIEFGLEVGAVFFAQGKEFTVSRIMDSDLQSHAVGVLIDREHVMTLNELRSEYKCKA